MTKYIIITTTFKNKKDAAKIGKILLNKKLISCYHIIKSTNSCNYKNKTLFSKEVLINMMSKKFYIK